MRCTAEIEKLFLRIAMTTIYALYAFVFLDEIKNVNSNILARYDEIYQIDFFISSVSVLFHSPFLCFPS